MLCENGWFDSCIITCSICCKLFNKEISGGTQNMKYKVGDKVRIKSLDWYNENKDEYGYVDCGSREFFIKMSLWCGKIATIKEICRTNCYHLEEYDFDWTDEMIECKVEEKQELLLGLVLVANKGQELIPHKDYEIKQDGNKFYLVKKKKEYPKTYDECCKILGLNDLINMHLSFMNENTKIIASTNYHTKTLILLNCLTKLRICRDAYWKIAGEEMGLDKPWEPDNDYSSPPKYIINCYFGDIIKEKYCGQYNRLLSFPTEEMRDAFYDAFKGLIEECKELL